MNPVDWLALLTLGGLLGAAGQGARAIVGLKKLSDAASAKGDTLADCFETSQLAVSLMIGFVAGLLAMIAMQVAGGNAFDITGQTLTTIVGAGYAGTDFIEGFMRREGPGGPPSRNGGDDAPPPAIG